MRRVVVTGMGIVSPIGESVSEFFESLIHGRSGIRPVPDAISAGKGQLVAGLIDFDAAAHWPPTRARLRQPLILHQSCVRPARPPSAPLYLNTIKWPR